MNHGRSLGRSARQGDEVAGGCLMLMLLLIGAYFGYRWIERPKALEPGFDRQAEETIVNALGALGEVKNYLKRREAEATVVNALVALDKVSSYLERLHADVQEQSRIIAGLKEEEGTIRPLVEADRATVTAILKAEARQRRQEIWWERGFSFLLGVISSLLATWLWHHWPRPRSRFQRSRGVAGE